MGELFGIVFSGVDVAACAKSSSEGVSEGCCETGGCVPGHNGTRDRGANTDSFPLTVAGEGPSTIGSGVPASTMGFDFPHPAQSTSRATAQRIMANLSGEGGRGNERGAGQPGKHLR